MEKLMQSYTYMQQYVLNCDRQFPLIAYRPVPVNCKPVDGNGNELKGTRLTQFYRNLFRSVLDCGFNTVTIPTGVAENDRIFDYKQLTNLKIIPFPKYIYDLLQTDTPPTFDENTRANIDNVLASYEKDTRVWAMEICDEPRAVIWQNIASEESPKTEICNLKNIYDYVINKVNTWSGTKKYIFFNIAVTTDKSFIGDIENSESNSTSFGRDSLYYKYLNKLQAAIAPQLWSYDYYPIITRPFWNSEKTAKREPHVKSMYYEFLADLAKISAETSRSLLAYVLCTPHYWYDGIGNAPENIQTAYPSPSVEYLRFQAFTAIAFGAKGLVFWNYGQGEYKITKFPMPKTTEIYTDAAINVNGIKTAIWDNLRTVIADIKQSANLFLESTLQKVEHVTNNSKYGLFSKSIGDPYLPPYYLYGGTYSVLLAIFKVGIGLISSAIQEDYLMLFVNTSPFESQGFSVMLKKGNYEVNLISPDTVEGDPISLTGHVINENYTQYDLLLSPGGYSLLKIRRFLSAEPKS